jgi:hypothetical protein
MIQLPRTGFAHRTLPRARRRLLSGKRSAGRAGPSHGQTRHTRHAVDERRQSKS